MPVCSTVNKLARNNIFTPSIIIITAEATVSSRRCTNDNKGQQQSNGIKHQERLDYYIIYLF
jgi:hypothetical protein